MPKVKLVSLGCDKNRVDSEIMLGMLYESDYTVTHDGDKAEAIIVNTCGFIRDAVQEGIDTVLSVAAHKQTGCCKALVVTGCMAQRYRDEIMKDIPEVDAVLGVNEYTGIVAVVNGLLGISAPADGDVVYTRKPVDGLSHVAYVKIAEGCDNRCAYCTIPSIRGAYRSRSRESILAECRMLTQQGARELVLVAQDTARYGTDLYGKPLLHELLKEISTIDDLCWIRVMYAYPEHIEPELITTMAELPKVCRYLDMPIQHSHDAVLARMGRRSTSAGLRKVIDDLRNTIPGIVLRTTLMVGFPGETEEEFEALCDFVRDIRFDRLGVFIYSKEDGTPAARMKQQIKAHIKKQRRDKLMRLQQDIHREKQQALRGQTLSVMTDALDAPSSKGELTYCGRSYRDAYETDAAIFFTSNTVLARGEIVDVNITGSDEYDLYGVLANEPTQ